jgi:hypothetical protein
MDKLPEVQVELLPHIKRQSKVSNGILEKSAELGFANYCIGAGCVAQTVWNFLDGNDPIHGIDDVDWVYFDADLSYEAEDSAIKAVRERLDGFGVKLDIKNQARVHLWYKAHFGCDI